MCVRLENVMFVGTLFLFAHAQVTVHGTTINPIVDDVTTNPTQTTSISNLATTNSTVTTQDDTTPTTNPTKLDETSTTSSQSINISVTNVNQNDDAGSTTNGETKSLLTTSFSTTTKKNGIQNDPNFAGKIVGVMLGIAAFLALVVIGGTALQKHMRRKAIKKAETPNPPPEFNNPVTFNADTSV